MFQELFQTGPKHLGENQTSLKDSPLPKVDQQWWQPLPWLHLLCQELRAAAITRCCCCCSIAGRLPLLLHPVHVLTHVVLIQFQQLTL